MFLIVLMRAIIFSETGNGENMRIFLAYVGPGAGPKALLLIDLVLNKINRIIFHDSRDHGKSS